MGRVFSRAAKRTSPRPKYTREEVPHIPNPDVHLKNDMLIERLKAFDVTKTTIIVPNPGSTNIAQNENLNEKKEKENSKITNKSQITTQDIGLALEMNKMHPKEWPPTRISKDLEISQKDAENLLKYFGNYTVVDKLSIKDKKEKDDMTDDDSMEDSDTTLTIK